MVLAGNLYRYQSERGTDKVPGFEFNREQSLASREKIEALVKQTGAQLWIEHAREKSLTRNRDRYKQISRPSKSSDSA